MHIFNYNSNKKMRTLTNIFEFDFFAAEADFSLGWSDNIKNQSLKKQ